MARKSTPAVTVSLRYCAARFPKPPKMPRGVGLDRMRLILQTSDKWLNGSKVRYWFFDSPKKWVGGKDQQEVVRKAFAMWKALGVGLDFVEVHARSEADVRIAFLEDDGAWSYIGTDVKTKRKDPRTMNFGWSLTEDPADGLDTALHEIGHTLGLPHEHQNPFAGIVWNEEAVYAALAKAPNRWSRSTTFHNIIEKLVADEVQGSHWDADSVMHYPFEPGLIDKPAQFRAGITPAGGLSARDRQWILKFYPQLGPPTTFPTLQPLQSVPLALAPAQQANFLFKPTQTREYEFRTFGASDTLIALYEGPGGSGPALAEDDDSGEGRNAYFKVTLTKGRTYVVRVRLYYAEEEGETAIMAW
jgi:hypothetical protein